MSINSDNRNNNNIQQININDTNTNNQNNIEKPNISSHLIDNKCLETMEKSYGIIQHFFINIWYTLLSIYFINSWNKSEKRIRNKDSNNKL